MTQPPSFKVCPQCQEPTALHTVLCVRCGRRFQSTAPPINQTQVFTPGPMPPQPQPMYPPMPGAPMAAPHPGGPRDQVEWMSSCIWTWIGLFFIASAFCFECRLIFDQSVPEMTHSFALLFALVFGCILTALVHRLRRLYIYFAFRRYRWWMPATIVAALIAFLMFADNERRSEVYARSEAYRSDSYRSEDYTSPPISSPRMPAYSAPTGYPGSNYERPSVTYPAPASAPRTTNRLPGSPGFGGDGAGGSGSSAPATDVHPIATGATFGFGAPAPTENRRQAGHSGGIGGGGTQSGNRPGFGGGGGRGGF